MSASRNIARAAVAVALALAAPSAFAVDPAVTRLPAPGSYALHPIQRTPDAALLDAQGKPTPLSAHTRGAVTALGFFYSRCADPLGCPVAWSTFDGARKEAETDPLLKGRLRLVFVSLDPMRDTPSVMRMLETEEKGGDVPWVFLTGASEGEMTPLFSALGQDIAHVRDRVGRRTGAINHMLKVFLIDPEGWVREIYSTAFLTADGLLNDARTLAMEFPEASNAAAAR
ncbi:SCO family protein [Methylocystis sp. H62]|uniref:SCO family protein n=1 Tax=Methylocystis sp. H62 TaxID=2785789 RepID=UPI0018C348DF|nr:SCO family protein [Methylocystis sp. H62]MBG0794279.1 SCO family protein [Methylocystis sp. H62]